MTDGSRTTSRVLLETMREAGIRYLFANLGSDHTGIIEAYAREGRDGPAAAFPELVLCPHEGVALPGSRNEFIQWLQDTPDQQGLVRGYAKYASEIRTGANAGQLVHRALQIARSEPAGPVYLAAAREVLEEPAPRRPGQRQWWSPVAPAALAPQV